ncbi:MAG: tetratricopeptide repeat protein [Cyclonatronaceae bacterium]
MNLYSKLFVIGLLFAGILTGCASDPNIESAKLNLRNADYEGVIEAAERALEENPENPDAYYYIGAAHLDRASDKPVPERVSDLEKAYENMMRADELYKAQEISSNEAESAVELLKNRWETEFNSGLIEIRPPEDSETAPEDYEPSEEELNTAIDHVENSYAVMQDSTISLQVISELYYTKGDVAEAAAYGERAIEEYEEPDLALYQRQASYYQMLEQNDKLMTFLEDSREIFPDEIFFVESQVDLLRSMGEEDQAMEILAELIEINPDNPQYRLVYGNGIYNQFLSMSEEANEMYDEYYEIRSSFSDAVRAGETERINELETEMDELAAEIEARNQEALDIASQAASEFEAAYEQAPENPDITYTLGEINENRGLVLTNQANSLYSGNDDETDALQERAQEFFSQALPYYEQTAELEQDNPQIWLKLYGVYTRLGMADKAEEAQAKAEEMF